MQAAVEEARTLKSKVRYRSVYTLPVSNAQLFFGAIALSLLMTACACQKGFAIKIEGVY
jgi:hypothetical protein